MGQKVHPLGLRIGITQTHRSKWYASSKTYAENILEDHFIRNTLQKAYAEAGIMDIEIERKLDQIHINIQAIKPGVFIGKNSNGLEQLRTKLEQKLMSFRNRSWKRSMYPNLDKQNSVKPKIALHIHELTNPNAEADYLADFLVEQLEKRAPFRRAMRQGVQRVQRAKNSRCKN